MKKLDEILNSKDMVINYNNKIKEKFIEYNWNKYCAGTISSWEMDALSFYYNEHELLHIDKEKYNITDFVNIPEQPIIEDEYIRNGKKFPKFKLYKIVGTVLDRDKLKHTLTILTPSGVVNIKFYSGQFIHYDRQISVKNGEKKEVMEKSWFSRGTKLMITGIRRDDKFFPKKYFDSIYKHTVCLIEKVEGKNLVLKLERERI